MSESFEREWERGLRGRGVGERGEVETKGEKGERKRKSEASKLRRSQ